MYKKMANANDTHAQINAITNLSVAHPIYQYQC